MRISTFDVTSGNVLGGGFHVSRNGGQGEVGLGSGTGGGLGSGTGGGLGLGTGGGGRWEGAPKGSKQHGHVGDQL